MLFVIHGIDKPGSGLREQLIEDHRAYLDASPVRVVASGPLMDDAGERMIGSVIVVDCENRETVENLVAGDPFTRAGLFQRLDVTRWYQRVGSISGHGLES